MKKMLGGLVILGVLGFLGCAGIEPPMPDKILTHPLGTTPLRLGMTKNEVREIWGDPDSIKSEGESKDAGLTHREEWIYNARMSNLPISYGCLSKPVHLYFDGNSLNNFKKE